MIDKNKKYTTLQGNEFKIYEIYPYKVHGAYRVSIHSNWVILSTGHDCLIEVSPYANLKIDDRVLVWDNVYKEKRKGHFAGINKNGKPRTWNAMRTSFTESDTITWDHCEPYTETEPNT